MSVPIALPTAVAYGVADFAGGLAARRAPVLGVTAVIQLAGLVALVPVALLLPGSPSGAAWVIGGLAGIAGAGGLLLYLKALALGPMGVVAPLSAVVGAGLPLLVGLLSGERLGPIMLLGVTVALAAIVLATAATSGEAGHSIGPLLGLAAGLGFGAFFIGIDATPADSGLWSLVAGRVVTVTLLGALVLARRSMAAARPNRLMITSGIADTAANAGFLLATRVGDLGISAVVVSLYPVVVVLLARIVLRERLTPLQLTGAGLAVGASVLLATG
jgi:drug/metabolite transporter (DMT)-like permease